ncbi:bifunctional riboflavin kinase/FAD synthetase [Myroides sp. LJL116]
MKAFSSINEFSCNKKVVATLGTFDGLHLGHQKIIKDLVESAKQMQMESLLLTFFPHPRMVLKKEQDIRLLNTLEEKQQLLDNLGLDNLVVQKFDLEFSSLSAKEFVQQVLVEKFNIAKIIIGYDHRFGKGGTGDIQILKQYGQEFGFEVEEISAKELDSVSISSTKIRKALEQGDIKIANSYLGYNYFFEGTVVKGKQLGRTLGFPTANLVLKYDYKLVPKSGVYVVESVLDGRKVKGMMNVGFNPTFENHPYSIEVNYLDFNADLYGKEIQVSILARIRDEQKFASLDELVQQLNKDKVFTLEYFQDNV